MALQAYPDVPLFRYPYTDLTEAQIQAKLARAATCSPNAATSGIARISRLVKLTTFPLPMRADGCRSFV